MNGHNHHSADEEQIQINISLDIFMPTPGVLYNYYAILKENGLIQQLSSPQTPDMIQVENSPLDQGMEDHFVI